MATTTTFDPSDSSVGRTVTAAGLRTHYLESGSGEPLIMLHGSGPGVSAWENWAGVIPALSGWRRVLAPDVPGFGQTEYKADGTYGMEFWIDHLFEFMDAVGVASAPIVGNSFGGMMGIAAALRDPSRVERLILMGTPAGDLPMSEAHKVGAAYEPSREQMERILRFFPVDQSLVTDEMIDQRYQATLRPGAMDAIHSIAPRPSGNGDGIIKAMPVERLEQVRTPTLVVHGREDRVVPFEIALRLHRAIKPSQLHTFGNCGHWVQIERRDEFVGQILAFVG